MSKAWPGNRHQFGKFRDTSFRVFGVISMPVAVGSLLLAPEIFRFLYGPGFDRAVLTYQLLVLVIPVRMLSHTYSLSLAAMDKQTRRTVAVTVAAVGNVGLNLYFIPRWSYLGAAITTVICETGLLASYALILRQAVGRSKIGEAIVIPGLVTIPMAIAILATRDHHLFVSAVAGGIAYGIAMIAIAAYRVPPEMRHQPKAMWMGLVRGVT